MKELFVTETRARLRTWLANGFALFFLCARLSTPSVWRDKHYKEIQPLLAPAGKGRQAGIHDKQRIAGCQPGAQPRAGFGDEQFLHPPNYRSSGLITPRGRKAVSSTCIVLPLD